MWHFLSAQLHSFCPLAVWQGSPLVLPSGSSKSTWWMAAFVYRSKFMHQTTKKHRWNTFEHVCATRKCRPSSEEKGGKLLGRTPALVASVSSCWALQFRAGVEAVVVSRSGPVSSRSCKKELIRAKTYSQQAYEVMLNTNVWFIYKLPQL